MARNSAALSIFDIKKAIAPLLNYVWDFFYCFRHFHIFHLALFKIKISLVDFLLWIVEALVCIFNDFTGFELARTLLDHKSLEPATVQRSIQWTHYTQQIHTFTFAHFSFSALRIFEWIVTFWGFIMVNFLASSLAANLPPKLLSHSSLYSLVDLLWFPKIFCKQTPCRD